MAVGFKQESLDEIRARLRKMPDEELIKFGRAARYMCSPEANLGQPPREVFVVQLKEARADWRSARRLERP